MLGFSGVIHIYFLFLIEPPFGGWFLQMLADCFIVAVTLLNPEELLWYRRSSWLDKASSLVICFILISLAGVRQRSKTDSHCEPVFSFCLTPRYCDYKIRKLLGNQREEINRLLPSTNDRFFCSSIFISFSIETAWFSKIKPCRGMAKETLKKIVSPEGKTI